MLKRLAAIIFVLAVTGQAFAGVCGCFAIEGRHHSCCKPAKVTGEAVRPKGCCDTECLKRSAELTSQSRTEATVKINFEARPTTAAVPTFSFEPVVADSYVTISQFADHRLKYSRPPELYLRHHAFLI